MKAAQLSWIAAIGLFVSGAHAATNSVFRGARVYVQGESFNWKEFSDGKKLLEESGPLYGIGGDIELGIAKKLSLLLHAGFFAGDVDYDGAVQNEDGTLTPKKSTTSYNGGELGIKITTPVALGKSAVLNPYAGFGLRVWERTLDTSYDSRYIGDNGYIEDWADLHAALGATIRFPIVAKLAGFATAELRIPLHTAQKVDLSNVGGDDSVDLEPQGKVTFFAEAGANYGMFTASVFIETFDFGQSDLDSSGQYLQPDSESQIIGARGGVTF